MRRQFGIRSIPTMILFARGQRTRPHVRRARRLRHCRLDASASGLNAAAGTGCSAVGSCPPGAWVQRLPGAVRMRPGRGQRGLPYRNIAHCNMALQVHRFQLNDDRTRPPRADLHRSFACVNDDQTGDTSSRRRQCVSRPIHWCRRAGGRRGGVQYRDDRLSGNPDRSLLLPADRHPDLSAYRQHRGQCRGRGIVRGACRRPGDPRSAAAGRATGAARQPLD